MPSQPACLENCTVYNRPRQDHCSSRMAWRVSGPPGKHSRFSEEIGLDLLPKNFSDAIKITRELGIAYIWIDALCIV